MEKDFSPERSEGDSTGHLADRLETNQRGEAAGIGTIENYENDSWHGLDGFAKALEIVTTELEQAVLTWPIPPQPLKKQRHKNGGSRWFLKMEDGTDRLWCMTCIQYKGQSYYFIEVGRLPENDKFSLSTILVDYQPSNVCNWIKQMIKNNGHWNLKQLDANAIRIPHRHCQSKTMGAILSQ